jgi:hypothetical protein
MWRLLFLYIDHIIFILIIMKYFILFNIFQKLIKTLLYNNYKIIILINNLIIN